MNIKAYQETLENQTRLPLVAWHCYDADDENNDFGTVYTKSKTCDEVKKRNFRNFRT